MTKLPPKPVFSFLTPKLLQSAIATGQLTEAEAIQLKTEDLTRYYNRKLQLHLRYAQWTDFFYVFHSAREMEHGVNAASYVMAAHAYEMGYANTSKSLWALESVRHSPGYSVTLNLLQAYRDLRERGIAPLACDWANVVNLCSVLALGKEPDKTKYEKLLDSPRLPWHYDLSPWKYSRTIVDRVDDVIFKHRRT